MCLEFLWQSSGSDSALPMQGAWVLSLLTELRFPRCVVWEKKICLVYVNYSVSLKTFFQLKKP